jgi:hypothetical protein
MGAMSFREYLTMREGLWLPDKKAVPGMSRINPFPATQAQLKRIRAKPTPTPKPFKPTVQPVANVVLSKMIPKLPISRY